MEARAINRFVSTSPRKMRLVIDLIRGRGVEEALSILHFSPKHAARTAEKVLRSAISNFQNKDEAGRVDTATLFVQRAFVDGGPTMKRIRPAPMGRAYRIRKRSNHITIVIGQREAPAVVEKRKETVTPKQASAKESKEAAAQPAKTQQEKAQKPKESKPKSKTKKTE
ncbi:MAG: 50S ribosomal protein L22 [Ignavibacteriales bacterium]|nr:50S ribosomal protein L22 [Ignavibacteriales bacterium]